MSKKLIIAVVVTIVVSMGACSRNKTVNENHSNHNDGSKEGSAMDMVTLTERDELYANIKIDTVKQKFIAEYTTLLGTTNFDERKLAIVTARIRGRLDKLFVRNPQQAVTVGQPLYSIYSEELLSYENEFLNALQQQTQFNSMKSVIDQLVESARKKLLLWGLTADQIKELEKTGTASALVTFYSPVAGTLVELPISEGQYVETGTPLFRIADLSQLWIEAQMYTNELKWLYENPSITVELDAFPGESFTAKPVFDNPVVENDQKISIVRFMILNHRLQLKPGMMAYVNIKRNETKTLVIPKSSILVGNMITAWIKTGVGMYENRMIQVGIQNKKEVQVLSGLKEGEQVVTNGSYLLNSALVLKKGAGMPGMEGMKM